MNKRDDAQVDREVEAVTRSAADQVAAGAKAPAAAEVVPEINAAVEERKQLVAELTAEPVRAAEPDGTAADPDRVTIEHVRADPQADAYLMAANAGLKLRGFTEHGRRHAGLVGHIAANVLSRLGFTAREIELAEIAGYLHDIGNCINREQHGQSGALLAKDILLGLGMPVGEVVTVMGAIGNHEEERGHAVSHVAAAVILADKADVHRSRVQNTDPTTFDIHDRVNYAAKRSFLRVQAEGERSVTLELQIDTGMASVMDYFEIFLSRMVMCRRAAEFFDARFGLNINGVAVV